MSYDIIIEKVPAFARRVGDRVIEGSNNSIIVLGTDRTTDVNSGYLTTEAGAIHIVVGRKGESFSPKDKAFMYMSMKSDPDKDLKLESSGDNAVAKSTICMKADAVRIMARESLKVVVGKSYFKLLRDGTIVVEGKINLGAEAAEKLVKESFLPVYLKHTHSGVTVGQGVTGAVIPTGSTEKFLTKKTKAE